jgi:hypothetical protein
MDIEEFHRAAASSLLQVKHNNRQGNQSKAATRTTTDTREREPAKREINLLNQQARSKEGAAAGVSLNQRAHSRRRPRARASASSDFI